MRKIQDIKRAGKTIWLMRSRQAKPLMVQRIWKEAVDVSTNTISDFAILIKRSAV